MFIKRPLRIAIELENTRYGAEHDAALEKLRGQEYSRFHLRQALAQATVDWRLQGTRGSRFEAIVTRLMEMDDAPRLVGRDGHVWTGEQAA